MSKPFITYAAQVEKLRDEKKLIITDGAERLWKKVQSDPTLTFIQKRALSGILQNSDIEISERDIEEYGETLETLRSADMTKKQKAYLEGIINEILDYLDSCVVEVEETFIKNKDRKSNFNPVNLNSFDDLPF